MYNKNILLMSSDDVKDLKQLGHGSDGAVYNYKNDLLIKLYHKNVKKIVTQNENDEDVKIYIKSQCKKTNYYENSLSYYSYNKDTNESIKILPKEGIFKAAERRKTISLTSLPIGPVYLNGHFAGCLLEKQKGIQIHKLTGLPLSVKLKIFRNILKAEEELLNNYIYHIDLSNSPYAKKETILPNGQTSMTGHSHILVNPITLNTNFIDLDGKSTIYTEQENKELRDLSLNGLTILALEFLFKLDFEEYKEEPESMYHILKEKISDDELIEKLIYQEESLEDLKTLVKTLKK